MAQDQFEGRIAIEQPCCKEAQEIDCCLVMPAPAVLAQGFRDAIWIIAFVEYGFCLVVWYRVEVDWDVELCRCLEYVGKGRLRKPEER